MAYDERWRQAAMNMNATFEDLSRAALHWPDLVMENPARLLLLLENPLYNLAPKCKAAWRSLLERMRVNSIGHTTYIEITAKSYVAPSLFRYVELSDRWVHPEGEYAQEYESAWDGECYDDTATIDLSCNDDLPLRRRRNLEI